ncbi:MAG: hypothetical protein ACFNVT_00680 [Corynebacterium matruchotii]|uniref:hypothetical protein n=1 Tax=Corynebacterium matruchotii TaxID=43768 RepID=UPI00361BB306
MYFSYGFERRREAEGQTLNRLASWVARHDDATLSLIFTFGDRTEFERIAQTYGGQVAWVQDITWRSPWTTSWDKYVGLITFNCLNPATDPAGAFFSSEAALQGLAVIAHGSGRAEEIRPIIVAEYTKSAKGDDPRDFVEKLMDSGALLVYALDLPDTEAILDEVVYVNDAAQSDHTDLVQSLGESSWTSTTGYERHISSRDVVFSPEEKFEEPVEVFYHRWSRLVEHACASPSLNMYLGVIDHPSAATTTLRETPGLTLRWCRQFPAEEQTSMPGIAGVFLFDKTACYPNVLHQAMAGVTREGEVIVATSDPDFSTKVMDEMICMLRNPMDTDVLRQLTSESKSFIFQFAPSDSPEMVRGSISTNNEAMRNIFHGLD